MRLTENQKTILLLMEKKQAPITTKEIWDVMKSPLCSIFQLGNKLTGMASRNLIERNPDYSWLLTDAGRRACAELLKAGKESQPSSSTTADASDAIQAHKKAGKSTASA